MPFSGILGAGIAAYTLKKYRKFKFQLLIYLVSSICSMIFFFLILETRNVWAGAAGTFMMGFTVIPIIPNLAEFSCEVVFPVGEGSAVGFLYMSSSIFSGIFIAILSSIITGKSQTENYIGLLIVCLSFGLGIVLTCFI
jgi:FLVCR family feline leukemia virus subgroup C receptor-related protein